MEPEWPPISQISHGRMCRHWFPTAGGNQYNGPLINGAAELPSGCIGLFGGRLQMLLDRFNERRTLCHLVISTQ